MASMKLALFSLLFLSLWTSTTLSQNDQVKPCIKKLMPCVGFLHSDKHPSSVCCMALKGELENNVKCLCESFNDDKAFKAFNITKIEALLLEVCFSPLFQRLTPSASPKQGQVLRAGEDKITVSWGLNRSFPAGTEEAYKEVKVRLCYAPVSQADRGWRKTEDNLYKDKTCQFDIAVQAYTTTTSTSLESELSRELPTATYFVRAYALDYDGRVVAYGQTVDTVSLFSNY